MRKAVLFIVLVFLFNKNYAQVSTWTDADRKYLLENLIRSKEELIKETEHLSEKQWRFKESPDRWSINEIVEHIARYEMLFDYEISKALSGGPQPELSKAAKPDSIYFGFIMEEKPHVSTDYTKPFTYSLPMGLNEGKNNVAWLLRMRNEAIQYVTATNDDLRLYFLKPGRPNVQQVFINTFGHTDRHLRQIRKVKQHSNYPK